MTSQHAPIRVAMMLASDGPGGAEMMTFRLAEELRRRGCTVVYVGPQQGHGWLGDRFRDAGFAAELVRIGRRWVDIRFARDLLDVYRRHDIDVVHSHEFDMAVYGSITARWIGIPNIVTMHGGLTVTNAWQRRAALRWAFRHSAAAVLVSAATRSQFARDLGVDENALTVIANGVPTAPGNPTRVRAEFGIADDDTVLLAVGTLDRNKGHQVLLDALVRLRKNGLALPWKLVIAGGRGGEQSESLREFITANALTASVHIVTGRNDIADLQAMAHIFVMPSFREGMPMALLEAMVAGKAIVASRTGGIPEVVTDGADGILVPPGDVDALAAALHLLLTDSARRSAMGAAARARGEREFSVAVMADRYLDLYRQASKR